jgi:hypothetical protein
MRRISVWMILGVSLLVWTGTATAAPRRLSDTFTGTTQSACLVSNMPFNENMTPAPESTAWDNSSSGKVVYVFRRNGTGTITSTTFGITPSPHYWANLATGSSDFTYTIDRDGSINIDGGPVSGEVVEGAQAGATFTVTPSPGTFHWSSGVVSPDATTITLSGAGVTTIVFSGGGTGYNICRGTTILFRSTNY